jgi:XTP/dITP diphosphohydrolase
MARDLVFATNNRNKLREVKEIAGDKFNILSLEDILCFDEIPEDQDTLVGNAIQKARFIAEKFNINCFADDTGLEVESLDGAPGVISARYAGDERKSADNIKKLLLELDDNPNKNARFRTVIALILDNKEFFFEGMVEGVISTEIRGKEGFGYDPIFIPNGFDETFAELPSDIKNRISHRALALEKLLYFLRHY